MSKVLEESSEDVPIFLRRIMGIL